MSSMPILENEKKGIQEIAKSIEEQSKLLKNINIELQQQKSKLEQDYQLSDLEIKNKEKINDLKCSELKLQGLLESYRVTNTYKKNIALIYSIIKELAIMINIMKDFRERGEITLITDRSFEIAQKSSELAVKITKNLNLLIKSIEAISRSVEVLQASENLSRKEYSKLSKSLDDICYLIDLYICGIPDYIQSRILSLILDIFEYFSKEKSALEREENIMDKEVKNINIRVTYKKNINIRTSAYFIYKNIVDFQDLKSLEWEEDESEDESHLINKFMLEN
ncbi:MAG: hypothetical protein AAFQ80_11285 [Cyanobacteria bacterium J06621_8]